MKIFIDSPIFETIFDMAKEHKIEWTMFAKSAQIGRNAFRVSDFIIPYQENSGASTEVQVELKLEDGAMIDPTLEWRTRDKVLADPASWRGVDWNVWIHSHNTMEAFWSGTDWEEIENMMKERTEPFLAIVVNAKREYRALLGIPALDMTFDKIDIDFNEPTLTHLSKMDEDKRSDVFDHWLDLNDKREEAMDELKKREATRVDSFQSSMPGIYDSSGSTYERRQPTHGISYVKEMKKDTRVKLAQVENLEDEGGEYVTPGWYTCNKDLRISEYGVFEGNPFQSLDEIIKRGDVLCWIDTWGTPIGLYNKYNEPVFEKEIPFSSLFPPILTIPATK